MTNEQEAPQDFLGLRTKREELGLTLKDIFASTRVSVVNLEAIEKGDFCNLPESIYTKNFIKTYARALDMDSKPILDSYETYLKSLQIDQTKIPETEPPRESFISIALRYKTYIRTIFIILVAAVVVFFIYQQYEAAPKVAETPPTAVAPAPPAVLDAPAAPAPAPADELNKTAVQPVAPPAVKEVKKQPPMQDPLKRPEQQSAAKPKPDALQSAPKIEKTAPAGINEAAGLLVIKATEATWLRIKIDQKEYFEVLLQPGERIERAGAVFDMDIGNAGGVEIQFKEKSFMNLGKSGQVIHMRLP